MLEGFVQIVSSELFGMVAHYRQQERCVENLVVFGIKVTLRRGSYN